MVSLGPDEGANDSRGQRGGYFFNDSVVHSQEDEELLINHDLHSDEDCRFKKLNTLWVAILQIIFIVAFVAYSFLLPYVILPGIAAANMTIVSELENAFTLVSFGQPMMWFLLLCADRYLQYKHTMLRRNGYIEFTHRTRYLRRTPEFMFSLGNAVMIVVIMIRYKYLGDPKDINQAQPKGLKFSGINYEEIVISIECLLSLLCCIRYAVLVYNFNKECSPPDAEQEEYMIAVMQPSTHLPDIGYRDNQYVDSLLERQADMIRYLKQHTEYLSKSILKLRSLHANGPHNKTAHV